MAKAPDKKAKAPPAASAGNAGTEVAEKGDNTLVLVQDQVPDHLRGKTGNRGSENVQTEDLVIPRLEVIQALSPVVKENDPAYNPDARPGMQMNSVTKQLYGKETFVLPVFFTKMWLVWKKRKTADGKPLEGGFFGAFNSPDEADTRMEQAVKEGTKADHMEIIDTPQHLCLLIDKCGTGNVAEVMLSMPRTKAKVSRQWNSMIKLAGGDRFSRVYRLTTQMEKNAKGDFYNYVVAQAGFPAKSLYDRAEKLYQTIAAGQRRVVMDVKGLDPNEDANSGEDGNTDM